MRATEGARKISKEAVKGLVTGRGNQVRKPELNFNLEILCLVQI
jgi:hypothetical protein